MPRSIGMLLAVLLLGPNESSVWPVTLAREEAGVVVTGGQVIETPKTTVWQGNERREIVGIAVLLGANRDGLRCPSIATRKTEHSVTVTSSCRARNPGGR